MIKSPKNKVYPVRSNSPKVNVSSNGGFTIIELIIYIALFSIVIGGGMIAVYQIIQGTDAGENQVILQEEANFILRKINWSLTGVEDIATPPDTTPTTNLVLDKNIGGTATELTFNFSSPNLTLKRNSGSATTLNSESISVSGLSFQRTIASGRPDAITTTFTLTTIQNGKNYSQTFTSTKYLRK